MKTEMSFEKGMSRLEEIMKKVEDPDTSVEESVSLYREAVSLIKYCTKTIDEAELQVKTIINGVPEDAGMPGEE